MFVVWMTGTWFEQAAGVPAGLRVVPVVDRVCDGRDARARGGDRDRPVSPKAKPKPECPRAHFHRAGTYCKACGTLIK